MGRANVIGGGLDGFYSIEIDVGQARLDDRLDKNSDRISDLTSQIALGTAEVNDLIAAQQPIREYLETTLIPAYNAAVAAGSGIEAARAALLEQTRYLYTTVAFTGDAQRRLDRLKFELAAAKKERTALLDVDSTKALDVWCVDLTEDAEGEVATIEIPGEPQNVLIAPGGRAPVAADGQLLARAAMTGPQAYWNAAVLPGWQKWMPDYRAGVISEIDGNAETATVTLTNATSTARSLGVNQAQVLTNVPIQYMDCDSLAFEDGDEVVIEFLDRDWQLPKVIGFLNNPKQCGRLGYTFTEETLIRGLAPDINRESLTWTGKSVSYLVPPTYTEIAYFPDFTDEGWAYFANGQQFWFSTGTLAQVNDITQNLTGFQYFSCRFEIHSRIVTQPTIQYGLYIFLSARADLQPGEMNIQIRLLAGANNSGFFAFNGPVSETPGTNGPNAQYFTFPTLPAPPPSETYDVRVKVEIIDGRPRLKINGQIMAHLSATFAGGWASLGEVSFLEENDYVTFPNFIHPRPRIDYWIAR